MTGFVQVLPRRRGIRNISNHASCRRPSEKALFVRPPLLQGVQSQNRCNHRMRGGRGSFWKSLQMTSRANSISPFLLYRPPEGPNERGRTSERARERVRPNKSLPPLACRMRLPQNPARVSLGATCQEIFCMLIYRVSCRGYVSYTFTQKRVISFTISKISLQNCSSA